MRKNIFLENGIAEIHQAILRRDANPEELAVLCAERAETLGDAFKVWVVFDRAAFARGMQNLRARLDAGKPLRPLEGMPVGVKDIYNTEEFPTQMGSPLWQGFSPGNDARVVFYLKENGAVIPGKTGTAEFAVHTLNETLNPHDPGKTPGTSSSGSAAAVALGLVPVSLGTQTAGSIVRPGSFCGIYGCKPSFGFLPRTGMLKTTDSLDCIGFFVTRADDLRRVFDAIRVHGHNYPFSHAAISDPTRQEKPHDRPWRIALTKTHTWQYAENYAQESLLAFAQRLGREEGFEVTEIDLPAEMEKTHEIHATIYNKALSYYFAEEFKRNELVSEIMNGLIESGNRIPLEKYRKALKTQEVLCHRMDDLLRDYDILLSLSTAGEAPPRELVEKPDPALMWSLTHLPVVTAPVFTSPEGLPFGAQLAARKYKDYLLFSFIAQLVERKLLPAGTNPRAKAAD